MEETLSYESKLAENMDMEGLLLVAVEAKKGAFELKDIPEEIHLIILEHLSGRSRDLLNCCRTWEWWNHLLHPQKPTFMAPGVLPHVLPYLNFGEILNCRTQCKTWKSTVDYALTYGPLRIRDPPAMQFASLQGVPSTVPVFEKGAFITFNTSEDIDKFTQLVDSSDTENPFIWRAVSFNFTPLLSRLHDGARRTQEEYQQFYDRAYNLMVRYGMYIWRFRYKLPDVSQLRWPHLTARSQFFAMLRLLKNVRSIELMEERPIMAITDERPDRSSVLPRLRYLKELHFPRRSVSFTRLMQQMIVFYGGQLNTIDMHCSLYHRHAYWLPLTDERLRLSDLCPNLMHLTIRGFTSPSLWQMTKCPQWRNLRYFQLLVTDENCCDDHKNAAEIWWLLKVIHQLVITAKNLDELRVDLKQPELLPFIVYHKDMFTINGTFDDEETRGFGKNGQMKLRVPTVIISSLRKMKHLNIEAYKQTPINGFRHFEKLREQFMPLDWFWETMPNLKTIAVDMILFDSERKLPILTDRTLFERPIINVEPEIKVKPKKAKDKTTIKRTKISPMVANMFKNC